MQRTRSEEGCTINSGTSRPSGKARPAMRIVAICVVLALLAGCASPTGTPAAGPGVAGDERGGKIPYSAGNMPAAMNSVRTHCEQFGKKGFITQMNVAAEGGQLVFECR